MSSYRLRNWPEYNRALEARGDLTLWLDAAVLAAWRAAAPTGRRGHPRVYSEVAIQCALTLKELYRQGLRQTTGLVRSLFALLGLTLPVPSASTLSRRRRPLAVALPVRVPATPLHLVVDSTGLKVYGAGEWRARRQGYTKRRTWLKVHLGVDEATGELRLAAVSTNDGGDGAVLARLLPREAAPLAQVTGDGGYDEWRCYDAVAARPERPRAVFPPRARGRRRPRIRQHGNCRAPPLQRDAHLRRIRRVGRARWKREVGYHRRSLAETAVFRLKTVFGDRLSARTHDGEATQVFLRCAALNRMAALGMPDSYPAAA
jgi:Transposase DDE domain